MTDNPLKSLTDYSRFVAELLYRPTVERSTPHHKHVPPDIKHHRVPASEISFSRSNLPVLIREIEALVKARAPKGK